MALFRSGGMLGFRWNFIHRELTSRLLLVTSHECRPHQNARLENDPHRNKLQVFYLRDTLVINALSTKGGEWDKPAESISNSRFDVLQQTRFSPIFVPYRPISSHSLSQISWRLWPVFPATANTPSFNPTLKSGAAKQSITPISRDAQWSVSVV